MKDGVGAGHWEWMVGVSGRYSQPSLSQVSFPSQTDGRWTYRRFSKSTGTLWGECGRDPGDRSRLIALIGETERSDVASKVQLRTLPPIMKRDDK